MTTLKEDNSSVKELQRLRSNVAISIWTDTGCDIETAYRLAGRVVSHSAMMLGFTRPLQAETALRRRTSKAIPV